MKIEIDITKSAQQNGNEYYNKYKKLVQKNLSINKVVQDMKNRLEKIRSKSMEIDSKKAIKQIKKEWFEKFHWFYTSNNLLAIGGRDATQNELLNSKYFTDSDLFFHSDIFGASVVILKDGVNASSEIKQEVSQFAASYSSAWKEMLKTINVYCVKRDQVSKSTGSGSISKGSFLISGTREYYRNIGLGLALIISNEKLNSIPIIEFEKIKNIKQINKYIIIKQGRQKKSDAAKQISKFLDYSNIDEIMQLLPAGTFYIELKTNMI
ncbi:MAG: NFACT family protein [Candidatus Marsarchaeota archaeon]|nr:NFACT family protein [Candidatus Marsarchaeota archaeon]MCL5094452.1 NFACT family protein [Candidatus Marsarchaeota archaeon]